MKKLFSIIVAIFCMAAAVCVTSCDTKGNNNASETENENVSKSSEEIVGIWQKTHESYDNEPFSSDIDRVMCFNSDGTYVIKDNDLGHEMSAREFRECDDIKSQGTYNISGDKLILVDDCLNEEVFIFKISNGTLTIKAETGDAVLKFKRIK